MPMIRVELLKGRSVAQKREFASVLTAEASRILKCPPDGINVVFIDIDRDDWATAGVLVADK